MPRHRVALPRAALPAAVLVLAGLASALALPVGGMRGLLALLCAGAAGVAAGLLWLRGLHRSWQAEARQQQHLLSQMLDQWQWQTDAEHRLVRLQPPQGAPTSCWVEGAFSGEWLWQRFDDDQHTLQSRLQAAAPIQDLEVARLHGGAPSCWRLRGLPRLDRDGRFAGYLGVATVLRPAPEGAAAAVAAAPDGEVAALSYTISHDLRAPLRVVEGFTRILKEDYAAALDRVAQDHLDRVLSAAARMNAMIDAMLSLARLSTQPLARAPADLSQLAHEVADELRRGAPERSAEFRIEDGLAAVGDPTLLRNVIENLLGNAWKYSAKIRPAEIAFEQVERDGRRVFVVRDNGAGFDMRYADRLFGVFQRLHGSSEFPGHGVGLASVQRIVRRHGGEIWAEAEVGRGACFYFTLGG